MQCTINTNVCVCSSHHCIGDLMLIAVDQRIELWKEPIAYSYILKSIASDTLHCLTISILDN